MSIQGDSNFTISVGKQVLRTETNDGRFEAFCREVVSNAEGGALILGTSASWDLGRDGVGFGRATGIYVCVSLRDDVDGKALSDIERLIATTNSLKKIYFCSSHELSEYKRSKLAEQLIVEVDYACSIEILSSSQLIEIASRDVAILHRYYGAEIDDCLKAISAPLDEQTEKRGLRLALMSFGEDSAVVRAELYESAILEILVEKGDSTLEVLTNKISERLHLMRSLSKEALVAPLQDMMASQLILKKDRLYSISEIGKEKFSSNLEQAATQLLSGRIVVREAIEDGIGGKLSEDHFSKMWLIFEDKMVAYCISKGETLVAEVGELIDERISGISIDPHRQFSFVDEIAAAVANTSSSPQQRIEIEQAVKDIFHHRTGPATDWLVRLCMSFVAACSLGMEHTCGSAIEQLLKKTTLVLDTDVVLSLLGEGENDHEGVEAIVNRWKQFDGKLLVGEPVLEEVAYHASIANLDYQQVNNWLPGSEDDRQHIINNVFVRSFAELLSKKQIKSQYWHAYVRTFVGNSNYDWSRIFTNLASEYQIQKLPQRASTEEVLEKKVQESILELNQGAAVTAQSIRNIRDKARRDAQLYSGIVSYLKALRRVEPSATCLLVSSAHRLSWAEQHFKEADEPELVTSISTVLHLISLVPNVKLGASAMKAFLFDERPKGFSSDFERTLMRMLRASEQVSLPWAKRAVLRKSLREKMMQDAKSRGVNRKAEQLEKEALLPNNQPRTIELLRDAFDAIAVDTKVASENAALRKRIAELEEQAARRSAPKKR